MNTYSTTFFATCPNNGARVEYRLRIETTDMIQVEQIVAAVDALDHGFHEDFADELSLRFGGVQTLAAHHHGVQIETIRSSKAVTG